MKKLAMFVLWSFMLMSTSLHSFSLQAAVKEEMVNKWSTDTTFNRVNKATDFYGELQAEDNDEVFFSVRCLQGEVELYLNFERPLAPSNQLVLSIQRDNNKVEQQTWSLSEDHSAVFAADAAQLAKDLLTTKQLVLSYQSETGITKQFTFDIAGFDTVYQKAQAVCVK